MINSCMLESIKLLQTYSLNILCYIIMKPVEKTLDADIQVWRWKNPIKQFFTYFWIT